MSLLLDARKKAQAAREAGHVQQAAELKQATEPGPMEHLHEADPKPYGTKSTAAKHAPHAGRSARSAGQNLFNAKWHTAKPPHALPKRNLLFVLCGAVLLLVGGAAYLWHLGSASDTGPQRPVTTPPVVPTAQQQAPATAGTRQPGLVPGITVQETVAKEPGTPMTSTAESSTGNTQETLAATAPPAPQLRDGSPARQNDPIRIEQRKTELVDPLLGDAYLAYRSGKLDEAQQLYLAMFKKDARSSDALLGLATIAQQRGENLMAAQYYAHILALDPRNALANAGMSALSADDERNESRLKTLLREQGNSAALHFALGNLYARHSRWGEAQQAYFNAYTLESGNAEFAFNLAVSLDHLGQKKLAAQHYQHALELDQAHAAGFDHTQISQRAQELAR